MDAVTIAHCSPGHRATKLISAASIAGYDCGKLFAFEELPVADLGDLAGNLTTVSRDTRRFVLRGELLPGVDPTRCRRLLYTHEDGTPATFREVPRRWVVIDFDNVPGPYRFNPHDGELAAIYCRTLLPEPWQRCSYWWGLSSSAGFKSGVRIKLAFWLDRPCLGGELERYLAGCAIDASVFRAVQPIYVARPILVGNSEAIAYRRLAALCRGIERAAVGGRHRCLIWAAARAVELDDVVPRAVIAAELIAAARRAGLDDHEADLARQVRNGFKLGIFGAEAA